MKYAQLKYKPTGNVFKMAYEDAVKIFEGDEDNYEIAGRKPAEKPVEEAEGIFNQVVVDIDKAKKKNVRKN